MMDAIWDPPWTDKKCYPPHVRPHRLFLLDFHRVFIAIDDRIKACTDKDEDLQLMVESDAGADALAAQKHVISLYKLHHSAVRARHIRALPVTASGKKDYSATEREFV